MSRYFCRGVVLGAGLIVVGVHAAMAQQTLKLTLDDAIARGLANSQRLAELEARSEAADASTAGRAAERMPVIAVLGGYTRTNHVDTFGIELPGQAPRIIYPDVPDNLRSRLDLQWPVYSGGRTAALTRAAQAERRAAGDDIAAARADLRLEIVRAFWALVTATATEQVVGRSLDSMGIHVRDLRSRLEQGLIPPNEVLSSEAQQSRERLLAIEAQNIRQVAEADLRRLLGITGDTHLEAAASLEPPAQPPSIPPPDTSAARTSRPERRALENRLAALRERETAAASAALPQIGIGAGYDYARPNPRIFPRNTEWRQSWDVSVNASWTLWDGGRRRAQQAESAAAVRGARARVGEFDRQLVFEVRQRSLEVDSSRAAIAAAADGVRAAVEARRVVGERFRAGVATSTEVLDAEVAVLQAELDQTRSFANARLADARLARATGQ